MILRIYRTNQTVVQLSLPLLMLVLWLVHFFYPVVPVGKELEGWFAFNPGIPKWSLQLIQGILIVIEAILFNRIINDLELFDRVSFVPSAVYVMVAFLVIPNGDLQLSGFSGFFILQGIHTLLQTYRESEAKQEAFLAGFLFGIAFLFSWTLLPLLAVGWISLNMLKTFYWREWLLHAMGFFLPVGFFQSIYFSVYAKWSVIDWLPDGFDPDFYPLGHDRSSVLFWISLLVVVLFGLLSLLTGFRGTIIRVRKQRQVLIFLSLIMVAISVGVNGFFQSPGTVYLVIPFSFFIAYMLVHSAFQWLTDLLVYAVILLFLLSRMMPV